MRLLVRHGNENLVASHWYMVLSDQERTPARDAASLVRQHQSCTIADCLDAIGLLPEVLDSLLRHSFDERCLLSPPNLPSGRLGLGCDSLQPRGSDRPVYQALERTRHG